MLPKYNIYRIQILSLHAIAIFIILHKQDVKRNSIPIAMYKSKFISLLGTLTSKEVKEFKRFLEGLYSRQKIAIELFSYVEDFHPKYDSPKLEKEQAVKTIFGISDIKVKDKKNLSNTLSDLYTYLEEFLMWKQSKERSFDRSWAMLKVFRNRRLDKLYVQQIEQQLKILNAKSTPQDMWLNLKKMQLQHKAYFSNLKDKVKLDPNSLKASMLHLDKFFSEAKLRYSAELSSRAEQLKEDYNVNFYDEIIKWVKENLSSDVVYRQALFQSIDLLKQPDDQLYFAQKKLLLENHSLIGRIDFLVLFTYLFNYLSRAIRNGQHHLVKELFELYQFGLKHEYFIEDGFITYVSFHNITNVACKLHEFEWAEKFIEEWSGFLAEDIREHTCKISWALLYFEKKEFEKTIDTLKDIQMLTITYFSIRSRWLTVCSFYELKYSRTFILDYCKSFEVFLKRNKTMNAQSIESYINLIRFIRMFLRKSINKATILQELEVTKLLACRMWVIEKIKEIGN